MSGMCSIHGTYRIQDTNKVGHSQHMGYTHCEMYTLYRGQTECTVHTQNGRNPRHVLYVGLLPALLSPPMPCSLRHNASTWLGRTIAPFSRLMTLPPSATGTPGVGFWRGGCPENKPHKDQEKQEM